MAVQVTGRGSAGPAARQLLSDLLALPPPVRTEILAGLDRLDFEAVLAACEAEFWTPYALWRDDPVGFIEGPLGVSLYSVQRQIAASLAPAMRTESGVIVAAPSSYQSGKTFLAAGLVLWWGAVHPPGTALAVTTATRFRQVQRLLWPVIRNLHGRAQLPGKVDTVQWTIPLPTGGEYQCAYGFSAPPGHEEAAQGIHAAHLLIVGDESGGLDRTIGDTLRGLVVGPNAAALFIGNPPLDDESSWFQDLHLSERVTSIRIDAFSTPNLTGEPTARCRVCPEALPAHPIARHLITEQWARDVRADHGPESPFYVAKVRALFPTGGPSRTLPGGWLDAAREQAALGNDRDPVVIDKATGRPYRYQPRAGAWIRLGVDVASDGGDELAIARCEGDVLRVVHHEAGPNLANSVTVAGIVLRHIREAQEVAHALGTHHRVRVKIDATGVGWGVAGTLEAWHAEGIHDADIVAVEVAEKIEDGRDRDTATLRPRIKRDEMWLAMRDLLQPTARTASDQDRYGEQKIVLDIDDLTRAQLGAPQMGTRSDGTTFIESKKSLRGRGLPSPDRGEAALLSVYEPFDLGKPTRRRVIRAGA